MRNEPFDHEMFGEYLTAIRDNAGLANDAALWRASGVRASIISRWRRGEMRPSRENLNKIAAATGVPPILLWIQAGIADEQDLDMSRQIDMSVLPKPFNDLHEVYERLNDLGRGPDALRSISVLVAGLKAEIAEIEAIDKRRRDQPSGRRRAS